MSTLHDGPASSLFTPLPLHGIPLDQLAQFNPSQPMLDALPHAPRGACVGWGIPFQIDEVITISDQPIQVAIKPTLARWVVFMHTSDIRPQPVNASGFVSPTRGRGQLAEHAADYALVYADGTQARAAIKRQQQLGPFQRTWGENCFEAVAQHKPYPLRTGLEQPYHARGFDWGSTQERAHAADFGDWVNWLWAWENPYPEKEIVALRFEPVSGLVIISAISLGSVASQPLRWQTRRKACLKLPAGESFQPDRDENGLLKHLQLDLGQVISASKRLVYPNETWSATYNNQIPSQASAEILVEYTAHPQACFHLSDGRSIPVGTAEAGQSAGDLAPVAPADQLVRLRVVDHTSGKCVPV